MEDQILESFNTGATRALVDSPPGAGKTYLVESVVERAVSRDGWSVGVATYSREQRNDLAIRLRNRFPNLPVQVLLPSSDPQIPAAFAGSGIRAVSNVAQLQIGRGAVISTVAKHFSTIRHFGHGSPYDLMVVDEAYQVQYKDGFPLDVLARKRLMVGDPGQIEPFSILDDTEVFETARDHVLWALPLEMLEREPGITRFQLDISRRLPPDSVRIIQPAFYPNLPFLATSTDAERRLSFAAAGFAGDRIDRAIDAIATGASLVVIQLPDLGYDIEVDAELSDEAVEIARRLTARGARWIAERHLVTCQDDIGYCDSHVDSGTETRKRFDQAGVPLYFRDTPNVIQGRETLITIVKHPLSSMQSADAFHLDSGRLCVMLSRHKLASIVLVRGNIGNLLDGYEHDCGQRLAGRQDVVWRGYSAHRSFWDSIERANRIFQ